MIKEYQKQFYQSNSIQLHSIASEYLTNSSEELEAQRKRLKQIKQNESLNRQYSDEKHPKKLS